MRMKRILLLMTVVALMVVMLAMSVAPAFARGPKAETCTFLIRHQEAIPQQHIPLYCQA